MLKVSAALCLQGLVELRNAGLADPHRDGSFALRLALRVEESEDETQRWPKSSHSRGNVITARN